MDNQRHALWAFTLYTVLYESLIWGIFGWAVLAQGRSGWWVLVAVLASSSQLKPVSFGVLPPKKSE